MEPDEEIDEGTLRALASQLGRVPPGPAVRRQLLELAQAPPLPVDPAAHVWSEPRPGIRISVVKRDAEAGLEACLVWAKPGARNDRHRHAGDECILVLQGELRDDRGTYRAGEICRSRTGSVHHEEVVGDEDCICYVLYYGPLEYLNS
jgi:anti-sigma factor ChrR (cupin superfamily)